MAALTTVSLTPDVETLTMDTPPGANVFGPEYDGSFGGPRGTKCTLQPSVKLKDLWQLALKEETEMGVGRPIRYFFGAIFCWIPVLPRAEILLKIDCVHVYRDLQNGCRRIWGLPPSGPKSTLGGRQSMGIPNVFCPCPFQR